MPTPVQLPYPPLVVIESDGPITWDDLYSRIHGRLEEGVSVCLITSHGRENRGGYFFHMKGSPERIEFSTFDRTSVCSLPGGTSCALFINHVSGREFNQEMWEVCEKVNLRSDQDTR